MSAPRYKKILGLALGEKSLLAAEVAAGPRPQIRKLAEFVYPPELALQKPVELGQALAAFLGDNGFTAGAALVGIPVKWLLVKAKEVPPANPAILAEMLRLQAETEFSSELKDLVYDYAAGGEGAAAKTVLLLATPRKNVELAEEMCRAAKLKLAAVTPSALALGRATGAAMDRQVLVLSVGLGTSELTAQAGAVSSAIRHLRPLEPRMPFVSELRRTVSTLPGTESDREMVVWDAVGAGGKAGEADAASLTEQTGLIVHSGRLTSLGVDTSLAGANGDAHKYAAAVALAMCGLSEEALTVDFLHSRLAPPAERRIPKWAMAAGAALVCLIIIAGYALHDLHNSEAQLEKQQAYLNNIKTPLAAATAFVSKVSVAQSWHAGQPRYLACLRDLTAAIPEDGLTYATNFTLKEITVANGASSAKDPDIGKLFGQLDGKTVDQERATEIPDQLKVNPAFGEVTLTGTQNLPRERAVSFSITFTYDPTKAAP